MMTSQHASKLSELTADDIEKRQHRQQQNKLAARRCRLRRQQTIDSLTKETHSLEHRGTKLRGAINKLQVELATLQDMIQTHNTLTTHKCHMDCVNP